MTWVLIYISFYGPNIPLIHRFPNKPSCERALKWLTAFDSHGKGVCLEDYKADLLKNN